MSGEYRKSSTWSRIGILLAILLGLVLLPGLIGPVTDWFTERRLPPEQGFVQVRGDHLYRLFDHDGDGRIDCVLRVPAIPWARTGYYRDQPGERCRGSSFRRMPETMGQLADELLSVRRRAGLSLGVVIDVDDDGSVDCVEYDGTWRYAEGATCPTKLRSDASVLDDDQREAADRTLVIERELRSRWLDAAGDDGSTHESQPVTP